MKVVTQKHAAGSVRIDALNRMIHAYGESIRHFFRDQQRSAMVSPLFNIPGRMVLGGYCYYEHLPNLLRYVLQRETPEGIGQRMKRACSLPNYISLNSLMIGYLNGREQTRLAGRAKPDDVEDMATVLELWARAASVYRNDGAWLPDDQGFTLPVLPQPEVERIVAQLAQPSAELKHQTRRMMATLELFTFILNGESRIGVFHHGPYPLANGDVIVFKEMVGLQEDFYPWATPDVRLSYPSIARILRLRGVKTKIVLMGSMTTDPKSYEENVVAEGVFIGEKGELRRLPAEEVPWITQRAGEAQIELYRRVTDWDDRFRVSYGAELYGCILQTFAPAGCRDEFRARIRGAFRGAVERHADALLKGQEASLVLEHIAKTEGPIYAPIVSGAGTA